MVKGPSQNLPEIPMSNVCGARSGARGRQSLLGRATRGLMSQGLESNRCNFLLCGFFRVVCRVPERRFA